jgi:hypothetical protein
MQQSATVSSATSEVSDKPAATAAAATAAGVQSSNEAISKPSTPPTAEVQELEENGVRFLPLPNGGRVITALGLDALFNAIFEDWTKERVLRDEFLNVVPFFGNPANVLDAMSAYYVRKTLVATTRTPSATTAKSTSPPPSPIAAVPFANEENPLQKKMIVFISEWLKLNFTYFTDTAVLEALFRLLDRLSPNPVTSTQSAPQTPTVVSTNPTPSQTPRETPATASPKTNAKPSTAKSSAASPSSASASAGSTKLPALKLHTISANSSTSLQTPVAAAPPEKWMERELLSRIIQYKLAGIDPRDLAGLVVRMKHSKFGVKTGTISSSRGAVPVFSGADAIKWLRRLQEENVDTPHASFFKRLQSKVGSGEPQSARGAQTPVSASGPGVPLQRDPSVASVMEIDTNEVLTQLLKEKLISLVSSKSGRVRPVTCEDGEEMVIKKKKSYTFTITEHVESNARLSNLQPILRAQASGGSSTEESQTFFLETQPDTFARQLAVLESNLFQRIEPHEMHYWLKGDKVKRNKACPNLLRAITNINRMSAWVSTEIVTTANPKQRISTLKRFILVAQYCLKYKNYQGLLEIMGGLSNTSVSRLSAWRALPEKYHHMYARLSEIVNPAQNWKNYRPLIEMESSACIPYVGLFLSDLTFIHDGVKSELADGRWNWKKASRLALVFTTMRKMQRRAYAFAPDFGILTYLTDDLISLDEKELFNQSRLLEPTRARSGSIV